MTRPVVKERPRAELLAHFDAAAAATDSLLFDAVRAVRDLVSVEGRLSSALIDREQRAVHGLAWLATYAQAVRELVAYSHRLTIDNRFGETEELATRIGLGEYLAQIAGGIAMSQGEVVRLADLGLPRARLAE